MGPAKEIDHLILASDCRYFSYHPVFDIFASESYIDVLWNGVVLADDNTSDKSLDRVV